MDVNPLPQRQKGELEVAGPVERVEAGADREEQVELLQPKGN